VGKVTQHWRESTLEVPFPLAKKFSLILEGNFKVWKLRGKKGLMGGFVGKAEFPEHQISSTTTGKLHFSSLLAHFKQGDFLLFLLRYQSNPFVK